jgi:hypothetical protein
VKRCGNRGAGLRPRIRPVIAVANLSRIRVVWELGCAALFTRADYARPRPTGDRAKQHDFRLWLEAERKAPFGASGVGVTPDTLLMLDTAALEPRADSHWRSPKELVDHRIDRFNAFRRLCALGRQPMLVDAPHGRRAQQPLARLPDRTALTWARS